MAALDLSSTLGHGVNDGIPKEPFSAVQYMKVMKVDDVIDGVMHMFHGRGKLISSIRRENRLSLCSSLL